MHGKITWKGIHKGRIKSYTPFKVTLGRCDNSPQRRYPQKVTKSLERGYQNSNLVEALHATSTHKSKIGFYARKNTENKIRNSR